MPHLRKLTERLRKRVRGWKKQQDVPPAAPYVSITPENSSATGIEDSQEEQSRDSVPSTSPANLQPPAGQSFWDQAYDALAKENPDLVKGYDELLAKEEPMANSAPNETTPLQLPAPHGIDTQSGRSPRQVQLNTVIQKGLQRMEDNKMTIMIAGHEIVLADQITKAASFLLWGKELIGSAVKNSPEASIVWAGVSLIIPLLTNPTTAAEANRDGFSYVTSRMDYYVALEPMLRRLGQNASVDEALVLAANCHLVDLYRAILDFQLSSVIRFYRSRLKVYVRDTVTSKDWKQALLDIKTREQTVNSVLGQINGLAARERLESLSKTSEIMGAIMEDYLSVATQQLTVQKEQLAVMKDAEQGRLLAEERSEKKKCLQLFCLARNENSAMYDWYKGRVDPRVEGTCNWFLQHENFQKWLSQESGPLLVSADPGCGKSVLAKYLIDDGLARESATICYFFFKDQDQYTTRQALCALLHQLFTKKRALIQHAMELYNDMDTALIKSEASLWTILSDAVRDPQAGPIIFVIDALDECAESELGSLIKNLEKMFRDEQIKFKVLMTSRPYERVVRGFYGLRAIFQRIHIPGEEEFEAISQEINSVIRHRAKQLAEKHQLSDEIKSALVSKLLAIEHRTYLWVYLVFDYLDEGFKKTEDGIDAAIQTLPETVNQAYNQILNRSKKDETVNTVKKALSIILAARRPMTLSEMNVAMSLNSKGQGRSIYHLDLEPDVDFKSRLRTLCGLFVNIHHGKIYFLHQTAREFLLQSSAPTTVTSNLQWYHSINTRHAHSVLAEICIFYLGMLNSTTTMTFRRGDHCSAFSDYSARHWADHCREAELEKGSTMVHLASILCTPGLRVTSEWANIMSSRYSLRLGVSIHVLIASHLGLIPVTELLLSNGADIEATDSQDWTALMFATVSDHIAVIRLLLKNGANIEARDYAGMTALIHAANYGHEAVTRLLLENGANIEAGDYAGKTALIHAANYGHEAVTRLLLENGANIKAKNNNGQTALMLAAESTNESIAWLLLENGADIEAKAELGKTALRYAAEFHHEAVTRLLLENGADIEAKDDIGKTALMHAANYGHEPVTRLLLENGAVIEAKTRVGKTALMIAAQSGHEPVIRLLLENGADIEAKDGIGKTALMHAANYGHEPVTRLLLENGADIEAKDDIGRTALMHAARSGREPVTRLLLESGADIEAKDNRGWTALINTIGNTKQLLLSYGARVQVKDVEDVVRVDWLGLGRSSKD